MADEKMKETRKRFFCRLASGALAVWSGLELLGYFVTWVIAEVFGGISFKVSDSSTIGIIGGADGPTSVFVAAAVGPDWLLLLWFLLLAAGIWGLVKGRRK